MNYKLGDRVLCKNDFSITFGYLFYYNTYYTVGGIKSPYILVINSRGKGNWLYLKDSKVFDNVFEDYFYTKKEQTVIERKPKLERLKKL